MCVCVCVCVCACVRACVRVCARVRAYVCPNDSRRLAHYYLETVFWRSYQIMQVTLSAYEILLFGVYFPLP